MTLYSYSFNRERSRIELVYRPMECKRRLGLLLLCLLTIGGRVLCDNNEEFMRAFEEAINATVASGVSPNDTIVDSVEIQASHGREFSCPEIPIDVLAKTGSHVHQLTPANIKVVAALGDSLTAGFGAKAKTLLSAATQYRGVSWSIGGDDDLSTVTTLPNILRMYNPNVIGFSVKTGKPLTANAHYNMAIPGYKAEDMLGEAQDLVKLMKGNPDVDFDNDWKLITLFIGANDLCAYCNDRERYSPDTYVTHIRETLQYLKDELPRALVNVVHTLDVTPIAQNSNLLCKAIRNLIYHCKCAEANTDNEISNAAVAYREKLEELINSGVFDVDDDFTVVVQPFPAGINDIPKDDNGNPDKSFFAPDCFHFSQKLHGDFAVGLWNNMLEGIGQKSRGYTDNAPLSCPSAEYPFIFTKKNSPNQEDSFAALPPEDSLNSSPDNASYNLLGILLGSGIGAYVVTMTVIVAVVGTVWYRKRRRQVQVYVPTQVSCDTERITLLKD